MARRARPVVLLAARNRAVHRLVASVLRPAGFAVTRSDGYAEPYDAIVDVHPDLVVMESSRAGVANTKLLEHARSERVPVLVVGDQDWPSSVIEALDHAGADGYVARPVGPLELAARVRSLLRRRGSTLASGLHRVGDATIDLDKREVVVHGRAEKVGRSDWTVLERLLARRGAPVAYDELIDAAFGSAFRGDTDRLRLSVARLRRTLGTASGDAGVIRNVRGFGYTLDA